MWKTQVWRNCLYYSGEKDDATSMAREVGNIFDSLFADRILAQAMQQSVHPAAPPEVIYIRLRPPKSVRPLPCGICEVAIMLMVLPKRM